MTAAAPGFSTLRYEVADAVATITLARPERRNALSPVVVNELLHALDAAKADPAVRVVVLTGEGKAFSAGGDLGGMSGGDSPLEMKGDFADLLLAFTTLGKPTVARVQGHALGGGLGIVASCDIAIAAESAELGTPEVNVGLFPVQIMVVLARVMPRRPLVEMILTGKKVPAREAERLGLVTRAVADAELDSHVAKTVDILRSKSPTTARLGLAAFHRHIDSPLPDSLPELRTLFYQLVATEDAREGILAFLEKRPPTFAWGQDRRS
ncbi:MAG: enoyl-CoA hydratase/isomerase family protein [Deltaproteobacteria bacterium]|nr:enoyl-CoA hydratase/isomerase family protein [Deltaproteobacteria bacterium]